ncbi:MAG: glycosyltransferase family 4 protein [Pseudomonadota bacterium]
MIGEKASRLFLHATNVHQGGGKALLTAILLAVPKSTQTTAQLDRRMTVSPPLSENLTVEFVKPSVLQRLRAECRLARNSRPDDVILCFGNLPPLFKLAGRVQVFLQNRYLIDDVPLCDFPLKTRIRLWIERLWLSGRMANVDAFIVQTPSMQRLLLARTKGKVPVHVLPFMADPANYVRSIRKHEAAGNSQIEFAYVASGEPHKNHRMLVSAWCLLAEEQLYPSLKLTLDRRTFPDLCAWIEHQVVQHQLKISNEGSLPSEAVTQLYGRVDALIYPSTFESFGLPLIEARQAGLPILASELDYVRDVIDPEESFDPNSPVSIARAVKRFMLKEEPPLSLQNAAGFLEHILERAI